MAASYWTVATIGAALVSLHAWWFARSPHKADVLSGLGVSLAVLGILVTVQPLIRTGIKKTARRQFGILSEQQKKRMANQLHSAEAEAARHVFKERVFGVALIAMGTLLNGYASALAHLLSLPV